MMPQTVQLIKRSQQSQTQQTRNQTQTNQNRAIIFDSGALISFSMNGITDIIKKLKEIFKGRFLITSEVKKEIIDVPMKIKRFELEALKLKQLLDERILEFPSSFGIKDSEVTKKRDEILNIANSTFNSEGKDIHIMDTGEASCLALGKMLNERKIKNVIVIDERTTRILAEKPENLRRFLEKKLHVKIRTKGNLRFFKDFKIIRSAELVYVAYKKRLVKLKNGDVLSALLYAVKFKGAAISGDEIEEIKELSRK